MTDIRHLSFTVVPIVHSSERVKRDIPKITDKMMAQLCESNPDTGKWNGDHEYS